MLTECFVLPSRIQTLRDGPLGSYLDEWSAQLMARGLSHEYVHHLVTLASALGAHLAANHLGVADLNEEVGRHFQAEFGVRRRSRKALSAMLRHLLDYLRQREIIAPNSEEPPKSPWAWVLARYDQYLRDIHGLQPPTRQSYCWHAEHFFTYYQQHHQTEDLSELSAREVLAYVTEARSDHSPRGRAKLITTVMRSMLRFLFWDKMIPTALDGVIPSIRRWRLTSVPKHLVWEQVRNLIDGIDSTTPLGKRNRAIVLLLAVLGLRSRDVRHLEIGHIAWREGELHIPRTKAGRARQLPLPQEVGEALADYLLKGRPSVQSPYVFVSHTPPYAAPLAASSVSTIIRRLLRRLQIDAPQHGAHLLRHSLATHMVNARVPIKEIADILGHVSINTTAIYTKVDRVRLADVALPFPGGVR